VSITTVDVRTGDETLVALLLTPPFQVFLRVLTVVSRMWYLALVDGRMAATSLDRARPRLSEAL